MGRLIDADKLKEHFTIDGYIPDYIKGAIDIAPTAYDVDKVVEELHKCSVYKFQGKLPDGRICHFSDIVDIVKRGGMD
jgi:hypothetical protein